MIYVYVETEPLRGGEYELRDITCDSWRCKSRGMGTTGELNADGWRDQRVIELGRDRAAAKSELVHKPSYLLDGERHYGVMCPTCLARGKVLDINQNEYVLRDRVIEPVPA